MSMRRSWRMHFPFWDRKSRIWRKKTMNLLLRLRKLFRNVNSYTLTILTHRITWRESDSNWINTRVKMTHLMTTRATSLGSQRGSCQWRICSIRRTLLFRLNRLRKMLKRHRLIRWRNQLKVIVRRIPLLEKEIDDYYYYLVIHINISLSQTLI